MTVGSPRGRGDLGRWAPRLLRSLGWVWVGIFVPLAVVNLAAGRYWHAVPLGFWALCMARPDRHLFYNPAGVSLLRFALGLALHVILAICFLLLALQYRMIWP